MSSSSAIPAVTAAGNRRYDIDWLRVLAFALLILYHTGMFYVADWEWHIKSDRPSTALQNLMLLTNQWRMPLLFLISGCALYFACRKLSVRSLLKIRFVRLFIPLVFAMYVIVPPQLFLQILQEDGAAPAYLDFYRLYIDPDTTAYPHHRHSPLGLLTWNHLWFLAYLWHYTLVFALVKPLLDRLGRWPGLGQIPTWGIVLGPVALLTVYGLTLRPRFPSTHALFDDWYNHAVYFSMLVLGYLLGNIQPLWQRISRNRRYWLALALCGYASILVIFHGLHLDWGLSALPSAAVDLLVRLVVYLNSWSWILAILGFAVIYLNRPSPVLRYMNEAILPWYMLHQTIIIIAAYGLQAQSLPIALEVALVLSATWLGCYLGYEIIRRFAATRFLFGLKAAPRHRAQAVSTNLT